MKNDFLQLHISTLLKLLCHFTIKIKHSSYNSDSIINT